jgi:hypothetical protein
MPASDARGRRYLRPLAVCSTGVLAQTDSAATSILDADVAVDANAHPAITYIDADTDGLAVAGCNSNVVFINGFD